MKNEDTLPPADQMFRLPYEGYHSDGAFATVRVYRRNDITLVVATDESDQHQNTSVTNRIERVCQLAFERLGRPESCYFAEHYRGNGSGIFAEHVDFVSFETGRDGNRIEEPCIMSGRNVGPQFRSPQWTPAARVAEKVPELGAVLSLEAKR